MTIRQQNQAFNASIRVVEQTNAELIELYENALEQVNTRVARLRIQFDQGLLDQARIDRLARLERFSASILEDITALKQTEYNILTSGWVDTYSNGYYGTGYSINSDLNRSILRNQAFDYAVGYKKLNNPDIRQIFTQDIATQVFGNGIRDRIATEILTLQAKIKQAVTQALVEGIPTKELAKRLQLVDVVFEQNLNSAMTVARTELLTGHSYGHQAAVDVAIDAGVDGYDVWDATLDGRTRIDHRDMDGKKKNMETGLFTLPGGSTGQFPRDPSLPAKQRVNCRCRANYIIEGLEPNTRGARLANGEWVQVNGTMTYNEWAQTLPGRESIEQSAKDTRARAKRLAKLRNK